MTSTADLDLPVSPNGKEVIVPRSRLAWRMWLTSNHHRNEGLWIVYRKKSSSLEGPDYGDLVEEALCFGWIDSTTHRVDDDRSVQWFSPRRSGGMWSALNKERIVRLIRDGQMTEAGQTAIDRAKVDGSWSQTDSVDALVVPADLQAALDAVPGANAAYVAMADSNKKQCLWWILSAKRPTTRADRIEKTVRSLVSDRPDSV